MKTNTEKPKITTLEQALAERERRQMQRMQDIRRKRNSQADLCRRTARLLTKAGFTVTDTADTAVRFMGGDFKWFCGILQKNDMLAGISLGPDIHGASPVATSTGTDVPAIRAAILDLLDHIANE